MYTLNDIKYRVLCKSVCNKSNCRYGEKCMYAHNIKQQVIDNFNYEIYMKILTNELLDNILLTNRKTSIIYKKFYSLTNLCELCINKKCTGGFNCKSGAYCQDLLVCYDDFLYGKCDKTVSKINYSNLIKEKFPLLPDNYDGCVNGHHLTLRKLVPYEEQAKYIEEILYDYDSDYYSDEDDTCKLEFVPIDSVEKEKNYVCGVRQLKDF